MVPRHRAARRSIARLAPVAQKCSDDQVTLTPQTRCNTRRGVAPRGTTSCIPLEIEARACVMPVRQYAVMEERPALRGEAKRSLDAHQPSNVAELWAGFNRVAAVESRGLESCARRMSDELAFELRAPGTGCSRFPIPGSTTASGTWTRRRACSSAQLEVAPSRPASPRNATGCSHARWPSRITCRCSCRASAICIARPAAAIAVAGARALDRSQASRSPIWRCCHHELYSCFPLGRRASRPGRSASPSGIGP